MKAMGRSEPSSMICDKTAPIPTGEASQASLNGRPGSYWVSTISDVISFSTDWKASSHSVVHFHRFPCSKSPLRGLSVVARFGKNL